jgi:PTH2 family peptidyl-tRNA hydrolase
MCAMEYKQVIVVREDLDISEGKRAAQVAHAAVGAALEARESHTKWYKEWLREGQRKVVLRARDLQELRELHEQARTLKLPAVTIDDAGLTELPPGTTTCLGIGPAPEDQVDRVTRRLPLW